MPRSGFVMADAVVCEDRGRVCVVALANGHRVYARLRPGDWPQLPGFRAGDRVRVEVPVSDPGHGIVVPEDKTIEK
jgi:hypothetical protein